MSYRMLSFILVAALALSPPVAVAAPVFTLDDNPSASGGVGWGAEEPYGAGGTWRVAGPLAPSPSLALGFKDSDVLTPGPGVPALHISVNGTYVDAISDNTLIEGGWLDFSVDRVSVGAAGSAVNAESLVNQQAGDIYRTTRGFTAPGTFRGQLPPPLPPPQPPLGGWAGFLPTAGAAPGSNVLVLDESQLTLTAMGVPGTLTGPGLPTQPTVQGNKDNVDAFNWENFGPVDLSGKVVNQTSNIYFSINPDEAAGAVGASAADIYVQTPAGWALFSAAGNLGLDLFGLNTDDVDALIMWDKGIEGELNPGVDYALFSLSPGSASLGNWNLSAADVFFTDFTGVFATYATAADLGLIGVGGSGLGDDNVDALEIVPEPLTMLGVFLGVSGLAGYLKRRLA